MGSCDCIQTAAVACLAVQPQQSEDAVLHLECGHKCSKRLDFFAAGGLQ